MTAEKLLDTLVDSYHDGALIDALYENGTLFMYCFRNPPNFDNNDNPDTRYIIIRFENVNDLAVYDEDLRDYLPYTEKSFYKEKGYGAILSIDFLDFIDGYVVFEECLRFCADDVTVLAHSSEELDFSKYVK